MSGLCWRNPAIRMTHVPTGISAMVDGFYERSEYKRKKMCLKLLRSRVYAHKKIQCYQEYTGIFRPRCTNSGSIINNLEIIGMLYDWLQTV